MVISNATTCLLIHRNQLVSFKTLHSVIILLTPHNSHYCHCLQLFLRIVFFCSLNFFTRTDKKLVYFMFQRNPLALLHL